VWLFVLGDDDVRFFSAVYAYYRGFDVALYQ
jgi:hypothetical protein